MPVEKQKQFEYLLQNKTSNGVDKVQGIYRGKLNVKVWGTWDGASVEIQILAEDGTTWITVYTFSANGVQFGEVGSEYEEFRAEVKDAGGSTNLNATINYD